MADTTNIVDEKYYIYELIDPFTNKVRYVGLTVNPIKRYAHHLACCDGSPQKIDWVRSLINKKTKPIMRIIEGEILESTKAFQREKYWIKFYLMQRFT